MRWGDRKLSLLMSSIFQPAAIGVPIAEFRQGGIKHPFALFPLENWNSFKPWQGRETYRVNGCKRVNLKMCLKIRVALGPSGWSVVELPHLCPVAPERPPSVSEFELLRGRASFVRSSVLYPMKSALTLESSHPCGSPRGFWVQIRKSRAFDCYLPHHLSGCCRT